MTIPTPPGEITQTLVELSRQGVQRAPIEERLFALVYPELRAMAAAFLARERAGHTLQPTELVSEAYLRLVAADQVTWQGRAHFFGAAARAMRQILVDWARRRSATKRGGDWQRVTLPDLATEPAAVADLLDLDDCLNRLAELDPRMAQVVELRVFGDLTGRDIAVVLGVSERTVDNEWAVAKKWLRRELTRDA
ncbi:MAG TPA: ECF-type sigma factor [Candidatus Udaeobacter sp.]|nr:ECF-type sigma factor [Candidatus Udaeobacter sp.]